MISEINSFIVVLKTLIICKMSSNKFKKGKDIDLRFSSVFI
jgi:hypothetical protein